MIINKRFLNKIFGNATTILLAVVLSFFLLFLIWLELELGLISNLWQ